MIESVRGNLLESRADALVNPVNCMGVAGRGLALQFRAVFPENCRAYTEACKANRVRIGSMHIFDRGDGKTPRYIINFPTKGDWAKPSKVEWIERGLIDLVRRVSELHISSIAIPELGCGLGGLNWLEVKPLIVKAFEAVPDVRVFLYEAP